MEIKEYRKLDILEFVHYYDIALLQVFTLEGENDQGIFADKEEIPEEHYNGTEIDYRQTEIDFIRELNRYRLKRLGILLDYLNHCELRGKYGKEIGTKFSREFQNATYKYHFLSKKLFHLDKSIKLEEGINTRTEVVENVPLDLSDTIGTEKIIFLEELGILDYLRGLEPFKTSTNALATALSSFTGIQATTAQSYLNPITNPGSGQKNNPLKNTKKVQSVRQALNNIGYNSTRRG